MKKIGSLIASASYNDHKGALEQLKAVLKSQENGKENRTLSYLVYGSPNDGSYNKSGRMAKPE